MWGIFLSHCTHPYTTSDLGKRPAHFGGVGIRSPRVGIVCGLVGLVLFLMALSSPAPATITAQAQGPLSLHVGFLIGIESLNPFRGLNDADYLFYGLVYDYLFALDEDGNPLPNIATDAAPDAAGRNWTYTIRQGVKWHDGSDLTVNDVVFSINKNIENFFQLWAYEPYVNRIVQCDATTRPYCGAVATGPWEVTVYFDRPFVPGKAFYLPIIQEAQWGGLSPAQMQYQYDNLNPIGTGPYMADPNIGQQWTNGQPLVLHRNPNYHLRVPQIDDIYLEYYADEAALITAMRNGAVDVAELSPSGYALLAGEPNIVRQESLVSTQYWVELGFQQQDLPATNNRLNPARWDENVRRALAKATNKDYIINTIYQGKGVRGSSLMSPITPFWHYDPTTDPGVNLTYDIAAANAMLDQAGYDTIVGGVRQASRDITVYDDNGEPKVVPTGTRLSFKMIARQEYPEEQDIGRYLVAEWGRVGVEITNLRGDPGTIEVQLEPSLSNYVYGGYVETYIWYWSGDPDPNYLLSIESGFTLDGWNDNYWNNATYNQLYVDHLSAWDPAERQRITREAEKLHYQSAVYIIFIYNYGQWAYRTDEYTGWGDWVVHPYRQLNAFWTAPPLFLDLAPLVPVQRPTVSLLDVSGRPGVAVTITGTITDPVGSGTWTLDFGDGTTDATGTYATSPYTVSVQHTYAAAGNFTIRLTADNGVAQETDVGNAMISAVANLPPDQVALTADKTTVAPGELVNFTLSGHDAEGGTLTFHINFGDGTTDNATQVVAANGTASVVFNHTYSAVGEYFVRGSVSDGTTTTLATTRTVTVRAPTPGGEIGPAGIDMTLVAVLVAVVIAAAVGIALWARRRRKGKEEERVGLPPQPPPPK